MHRNILEMINDGYFEVDLAGNLTFFNGAVCRILGYSKEELMGMNYRNYTDPADAKRVFQAYNLVYKTEDPIMGFDWKVIGKSGARRHIEGSISLLKDSSGNKTGFLGVVNDVSERKRAEALLKESEQRYRLLAENLNDIIVTMDMNLNFTYISPSVYRVLGYTTDEFMSMKISDMVDPDTFNLLMDIFKEELETEKRSDRDLKRSRTLEYKHIRKDGSKVWMETTLNFLRNDNKDAIGIIGIMHDISDRKQMEEQLRFEEKRFRNLVEHSSDVIVVVNLEGNIVYQNPAIEKVLGYKPEERAGKRGMEIVHPDDVNFLAESFLTVISNPNTPAIRGEVRLRHKDGTYRTLEAVGSSLVKDHVVEAVIINYRDITERKLAEEALKESEQRYLELSIIDDLTQLYNSRHFYAQLEREIERSKRYEQPLTLLMIDIDKFKDFNDAYGHIEGDNVLARLGRVIKRCLRDSDTAYRYGGEEFTIILPMTTSRDGFVTAERIKDELNKEVFTPVPGKEVIVTMSIGVAEYQLIEDMKIFVNRTDQFMYRAKHDGRNRICCEA